MNLPATPVMRQYREAKERHPDGILLFRLGDFYEIFFDDAKVAAPIMGVQLTSRPLGKTGRAPMCGVPHHAWQSYVGRLLRAGHKVVICDQVEPAGKSKIVRRDVTRVLTPGTVVEDAYLEPSRPNYLVAAWSRGMEAGIAACEVSTGELLLCQLPKDRLQSELERLAPAELLTPPDVEDYRFDPIRGQQRLKDLLGIAFPASVGAADAPLAVGAAGVVLDYLKQNQSRVVPGSFSVRTYSPDTTMPLDAATVRNLELPALVEMIDRTSTPIGARQLRAWLGAPLRDAESIELRLAAVAELVSAPALRDRLQVALKPVGDLERLVSRAAQGHASARELVGLRRSLEAIPGIQEALGACSALVTRGLQAEINAAPDLADKLARALIEDPPSSIRGGSVIRHGYDSDLDAISAASRSARDWIAKLEATERRRSGIRSLKVGFNKVFGYYIEVSHANTARLPDDYVRKQTLTGGERYITPELKEKEAVVLSAQERIAARELEILHDLGVAVGEAAPVLRASAQAMGMVDALLSLAVAAAEHAWRRPEVNAGLRLSVKGGRHPLVETGLPAGVFVANDLELDPDTAQIVILTGPNMAGKSTYLRQAAVIVLLAQCGSFVPADRAVIGLADRVFTRVGAHDDISAGMSTFMVEMTETAYILNHATRSSLVILDEVGRGTSTYDGVSIAQAVVEHLHDAAKLGCRTLFATHYHELTALAERLPRVRNQRVEVLEEGDTVRFLHRVVPGGADRSYGIHVAAVAGLPSGVIARARDVLADLERQRPLEPPEQQLGLPIEMAPDPLRKELEEIDPLIPQPARGAAEAVPAPREVDAVIQMLAPEVADAIAAGEVIERPASVVKELVENALDGGALRISIDVRGAGKTSIRVSDDGAGIPAEELALAFVRHTTSKLTTIADLGAIQSFGFRGEALASIAAVADVECSSGGAKLRIRAGEIVEEGAGPVLPGVAIEVRDLFANVPARLKFLKSDATEVAVIKEVVGAFALLHPHVRFHLTIDSRAAVSSNGDGDRRRAIAAVYGAPVASEMLEMVGLPLVTGMVSQPRLSRGSRDGMVLAVNGRPISARSLVYALEECYQGRLERGRHPVAVIDIGIDPELVDVNVHPAKKEVRFRDEGTVFAALQRAVRSALDGSDPFRYRPTESEPAASTALFGPQLTLHDAPATVAAAETNGHAATGLLRPIGQAGPGYLVAEGPHGLVLVDQHAAHERVLYNRLLERLRTGRGASQALLIPQAVDVEPALIAAAADHRAELATLGLEYEEFGPRSIRITAVPVELPAGRATAAIQETLAALAENRGDGAIENAAAALACHSAVKFGDVLDIAEQRRLLADLEATEASITCPHGRPTRLLVEWQELTRHFRRNY